MSRLKLTRIMLATTSGVIGSMRTCEISEIALLHMPLSHCTSNHFKQLALKDVDYGLSPTPLAIERDGPT